MFIIIPLQVPLPRGLSSNWRRDQLAWELKSLPQTQQRLFPRPSRMAPLAVQLLLPLYYQCHKPYILARAVMPPPNKPKWVLWVCSQATPRISPASKWWAAFAYSLTLWASNRWVMLAGMHEYASTYPFSIHEWTNKQRSKEVTYWMHTNNAATIPLIVLECHCHP